MRHARVIPLSAPGADQLRDCGEVRGGTITVDRQSDCYRAWRAKHRKRQPVEVGPGTLVKRILVRMGYAERGALLVCANGATAKSCGCTSMQRQMDAWGWSGCLLHMPELIAWFTKKARACGAKADAATITGIIAGAWAELRGAESPPADALGSSSAATAEHR